MLQITPAERLALQSLAEGRTISQVAALLELREQDMDDLLVALFARMSCSNATGGRRRRDETRGDRWCVICHVSADATA